MNSGYVMNNRMPNYVPLAAALFLVGGCAGSSRTVSDGAPSENTKSTSAGATFNTPARGGRTEASSPETWKYDVMPTPNPTHRPGHRINEIGFADDSVALDREGLAICQQTVTQMRTMDRARFLIVGFSHKTESDPSLGQRRADAVRDCLAGDGLDRARFETASFGSQFSQVPNSPHPYLLTAAQGVEIWTLEE